MSAKTVVFFPEGAFGPTNNCVGIGEQLRARGHRVVFIVEESFAGTLEARGFEERLMRLGPPPEVEEAPGQFWKDFIRDTAPVFRKPTIEQLAKFIQPTWAALLDGARYVEPRLREIFGELRPDVIVEDNVCGFPAVVTAEAPWVRIASCNPLELKDADLPPVFSGYPLADRSGWADFVREYDTVHRPLWQDFNEWVQEQGAPPLHDLEFIHQSPDLNLYLYPAEADYPRSAPLDPSWHRLESCVRTGDGEFQLPEQLRGGDGALVYLSLGSLASADVALMERLVEVLGATRHRYIVSRGPQHDQYRAGRQHVGRGVPAPAGDPADRRPRDHPRRQQHHHRVLSSRQTDGRDAGVLGSVRQRPARGRDRVRRAAADLHLRARADHVGDRPAGVRPGASRPPGRHLAAAAGRPWHRPCGGPD